MTSLPLEAVVKLINPSVPLDSLPGVAALAIPWDSIPTVSTDSASMTGYLGLVLPLLKAQEVITVQFTIRPYGLAGVDYVIKAHLNQSLLNSTDGLSRSGSTAFNDCVSGSIDIAAGLLTEWLNLDDWATCVGVDAGVEEGIASFMKDVVEFTTGYEVQENNSSLILETSELVHEHVSQVAACDEAIGGTVASSNAFGIAKKVLDAWEIVNEAGATGTTAGACIAAFVHEMASPLPTVTGASSDPNAKYGPGAFSSARYIPSTAPLSYVIAFENDTTATLPAQTVTVLDTLDLEVFDVTTFGFTHVNVGYASESISGQPQSFVQDLDLTATMGMLARIVGQVDIATGIVRWDFYSIDPLTNTTTTNIAAGFLPPDTLSPLGQGSVGFSIRTHPWVMDGDTLSNSATIIFDNNTAIQTEPWTNIVDNVDPVSAVDSLPPVSLEETFLVSWGGSDDLSGIMNYSVYVSVNDGDYFPLLTQVSDTSFLFTGVLDSTYSFYSLATDSAGNKEQSPQDADAYTMVTIGTQVNDAEGLRDGLHISPNPGEGPFRVSFWAKEAMESEWSITDLLGRTVFHRVINLNLGLNERYLDLTLSPGVYTLNVFDGTGNHNARYVQQLNAR